MSKNIYTSGKYIKERPSWHSEDSKWKAEKILELIKRNDLNPTHITEIGCGVGEILSSLHQNMSADCIFNGFDISPQAIKKAMLIGNQRLMFHNEDVLDLESTKKWDLLLVIDVIEHVEDIFNFLRRIRSLGTYKVFHIPLDLSVLSVLRAKPLILSRTQVGHIHYFNFELALSILNETGYEVCDYFFTNGSIDLPRSTLKSRALKFPRMILNKISPSINAHFLGGSSMMILAK